MDKLVMSASNSGYLRCYDVKSGKEVLNVNGCDGESIECFEVFGNGNVVMLGSDEGVCYVYDIRKLDGNEIDCIGKIQRDGECLKKIMKANESENELIVCNSNGNIWKWQVDTCKDLKMENVNVISEWTGNEQFGMNDVAMTNECNNLYVATKNGEIKEYALI